jgi:hypothetical protein
MRPLCATTSATEDTKKISHEEHKEHEDLSHEEREELSDDD